jgi:class 3 adenylate cyclase/tetratricopeptide (TPR) repeat protein
VRRKSSTALPSRLHEVQNGLIQVSTQKAGVDLTPYVPRLVLEWVRDQPEARWQRVDGTMAFIDISGFTRMSELLAAKGRAGAEEVTEIINATFARLLDVAYADGGGLLKFGGDALLLFFSGPEHEARAARAAFAMRRTLRTLGRPRTSAGAVTLKMHAGLHCGAFDFFLVGDAHRELIVTGPAATATVEMESISEAGEIIVSAKVAERLDPGVLGEPRNGGRLLRGEAAAKGRFEPVSDVSELDLEALVPAAIRATLVEEATEGEHRQATVAFLAFSGTDGLLAHIGPEEVAAALDRLVVSIQTAAAAHRICFLESDVDIDGGRIILVAGVPETAGDDEERMLRALRAIVEAQPGLSLRIGVNRGRVFAGGIGAPFRRTYTILGDTAALAARLMARAHSGQILAAADVVERSATRFESAKLEPFRVKGKAEPVSAYEVGAIAADAGPVTIREQKLPLLGREREMTVLTASLTPARAGFGTLVELIGEPGIGKTRVVDELKLQASDMVIETAHCSQYESSTAYFPFRDLLRGLLDLPLNGGPKHNSELLAGRLQELDLELAAWIPLLAMPLDVAALPTKEADELQPAFRRARLHGVVELLLRAILPDPSLLVFEDVHWMDEASSDLLRHLGSRVAQAPWVLCTTRRPSDEGFLAAQGVPPVPALTLRLEPLSGEAAADLIAAAADGGIPQEEVEVITERAGGNPLFLQELIAAAIRIEEMEELPENVEAVVTTRIDELAPRDKLLLRWASVLGVSFSSQVITEVLAGDPSAAPDSESWDRLVEFVERDPYVPEGFRFRHALFRDAAYHGLSFNRRRELHARVGETLEHLYAGRLDDVVELLSLHFHAAHRFDAAWQYAIAAGRRAQDKFANVEAAEFYRRALSAARHLPELSPESISEVWEALGDVSRLAGKYEGAAEAFRSARRLSAKDSARQPGLFLKEGRLREEMGEYSLALRSYGKGFQAAELLPEPDRVPHLIELTLAQGAARFRQGRFRECVERCNEGVDIALTVQDLRGLAHGYYLLHLAYTALGSPERIAFRGLALPIYEDLDDLLGQSNVLNNLGLDAYHEGRWDQALDLYGRAKALRERVGDVVGIATITNNIGQLLSDQGRLDEAEPLLAEALDTARVAGARYIIGLAQEGLGRLAMRAGDLEKAERVLNAALAELGEIHATSFVLECRAYVAEVALFRGDRPEEAYRLADETLADIPESAAGLPLRPVLERFMGYALLQAGDAAAALEKLAQSLDHARETEQAYEVALALQAMADAGGEDAAQLRAESQSIFERLGVVSVPSVPLS